MQDILISDIGKHEGKEVALKGWLYNKRSSGKLRFLLLRDGTATIQCVVFKGNVSEEVFDLADKLNQESSVVIRGTVKADKRSTIGFEVDAKDVKLVSDAPEYPISPKEHGTAFLMDNRHLWLRSSRQHAILKIRSQIVKSVRDYFDSNGFILVDAPVFTPSACEGTSTLFETDYFDKKAYLTQSGQLYMEAAAMAHRKVYCFGPTFRAEKSKTRRHLTEFWMVEPEVAYFDLNDDMDLAEDFVCSVLAEVVSKKRKELELLERDISKLEAVKKPFPRITYTEAIEILKKKGVNVNWGDDFGGDDETVLSKEFDRPFIVNRYPMACKAFYMKSDPENPKQALCMDMLAPEGYGEIIGGGQREDSYDVLADKIKAQGLEESAFSWYLDLRKYGSVPHAGFGLGIERFLAWTCGLHHVRETIPFPRLMDRLAP
ncbi:asparagine--tRNA ligase [Elusimicrobiota bacterium]